MPWELQICRFCGKGYGHKTGLRNHLSQYVGNWRIPADGVHDVLEIQKILYPDDDPSEYRCPSRHCQKIISTRQKFTHHVIANSHWGGFSQGLLTDVLGRNKDTDDDSVDLSNISEWVLPFDEEAVKVFKPEGSFPFLRLPPELRLMVYEMALCYPGIQFFSTEEDKPSARKGKFYFQHNTDHNPLALLIASRGIYEEARGIFYGKNEFLFSHIDALPVFLIGIGPENANLLRSVRWWGAAERRYDNQLDSIRPYIRGIAGQNSTKDNQLNIWNDYPTYLAFLNAIGRLSCIEPLPEPHRLLLWNPNDSSRAHRIRYHLRVRFTNTGFRNLFDYTDWHSNVWLGGATYEVICHVEKSGR